MPPRIAKIDRMLIPRFTVRWLLLLTSVCAVIAYVVSLGIAGRVWAIALAASLGSLVFTFVLYAAVFCLAWLTAVAWRSLARRRVTASPFATHTPPPQLLEPDQPD